LIQRATQFFFLTSRASLSYPRASLPTFILTREAMASFLPAPVNSKEYNNDVQTSFSYAYFG
jgi:hypothetical protein